MYLTTQRLITGAAKPSGWCVWDGTTDGPTYSYLTLLIAEKHWGYFCFSKKHICFLRVPRWPTYPHTRKVCKFLYKLSQETQAIEEYFKTELDYYFDDDLFLNYLFKANRIYVPPDIGLLTHFDAMFIGDVFVDTVNSLFYVDIFYHHPVSHKFLRYRYHLGCGVIGGITLLANLSNIYSWKDCICYSQNMHYIVMAVVTDDNKNVRVTVVNFVADTTYTYNFSNTDLGLSKSHLFDNSLGVCLVNDGTFLLFYRNATLGKNYCATMKHGYSDGKGKYTASGPMTDCSRSPLKAKVYTNVNIWTPATAGLIKCVKITDISDKHNTVFTGFHHGKRIHDHLCIIRLGTTVHVVELSYSNEIDIVFYAAHTDEILSEAYFDDDTYFGNIGDNSFVVWDGTNIVCRFYDMGQNTFPRVKRTQNAAEILVGQGSFLSFTPWGADNSNLVVWSATATPYRTQTPEFHWVTDTQGNKKYLPHCKSGLSFQINMLTYKSNGAIVLQKIEVSEVLVDFIESLINVSECFYFKPRHAAVYINYLNNWELLQLELDNTGSKRITMEVIDFQFPVLMVKNIPYNYYFGYYYSWGSYTVDEFVGITLTGRVFHPVTCKWGHHGHDGGMMWSIYNNSCYGYKLDFSSGGAVISSDFFPTYPVGLRYCHGHWRSSLIHHWCWYNHSSKSLHAWMWIGGVKYEYPFFSFTDADDILVESTGLDVEDLDDVLHMVGAPGIEHDDRYFICHRHHSDIGTLGDDICNLSLSMHRKGNNGVECNITEHLFKGSRATIYLHEDGEYGTVLYFRHVHYHLFWKKRRKVELDMWGWHATMPASATLRARRFKYDTTGILEFGDEVDLELHYKDYPSSKGAVVIDDETLAVYKPSSFGFKAGEIQRVYGGNNIAILKVNGLDIFVCNEITVPRKTNRIVRIDDHRLIVDCTDGTDLLPMAKFYVMSDR